MIFERDREGTLVRFEYHGSPTAYALMTRNGTGGMQGREIEKPVERIRVARGGRISSSLGNALTAAGLRTSVAGVFIEALGNRFSFATSAREGDTWKIVLDEERVDGRFLDYGQIHAVEYVSRSAGTLRAFYYEVGDDGEYYDENGRSTSGGVLRTPLRYDRISSPFDPERMHPILRRVHPHNGVDYAASTGTPVWAAADGEITWAGPKGPNGNLVSIRHAGGLESHYAHLHQINRGIRPGVRVESRQQVGTVGTTGRSTGPHLHFGVKRNGNFVDPLPIINGPGRRLSPGHLAPFRRQARVLVRELEAIEVPGS